MLFLDCNWVLTKLLGALVSLLNNGTVTFKWALYEWVYTYVVLFRLVYPINLPCSDVVYIEKCMGCCVVLFYTHVCTPPTHTPHTHTLAQIHTHTHAHTNISTHTVRATNTAHNMYVYMENTCMATALQLPNWRALSPLAEANGELHCSWCPGGIVHKNSQLYHFKAIAGKMLMLGWLYDVVHTACIQRGTHPHMCVHQLLVPESGGHIF